MDHKPNALIRMIQYGERERVLKSHAIWLCVSCMTCGVRCPNKVDMSAVMDTLREMSIEAGYAYESEKNVVILHEEFVRNVKLWGRLHEATFFLPYMFRSGDLFSNLGSGMALMARGKLPLIPGQIKGIEDIWELYEKGYGGKGKLFCRKRFSLPPITDHNLPITRCPNLNLAPPTCKGYHSC